MFSENLSFVFWNIFCIKLIKTANYVYIVLGNLIIFLANVTQLVFSWTRFWKFCYFYWGLYKYQPVLTIKEIFGENSQHRHLKFTVSAFSFVWNVWNKHHVEATEPLPTSLRPSSHSRHCAGMKLKIRNKNTKREKRVEKHLGRLKHEMTYKNPKLVHVSELKISLVPWVVKDICCDAIVVECDMPM